MVDNTSKEITFCSNNKGVRIANKRTIFSSKTYTQIGFIYENTLRKHL